MSEIKRFDVPMRPYPVTLEPKADGRYCLVSDLARVEQERDRLRAALEGMVGLHDDPTPYDSATTIAAAREALSSPSPTPQEPEP